MGLESYQARYTFQLTDWSERAFKKRGMEYVIVPGTTIDNSKANSIKTAATKSPDDAEPAQKVGTPPKKRQNEQIHAKRLPQRCFAGNRAVPVHG